MPLLAFLLAGPAVANPISSYIFRAEQVPCSRDVKLVLATALFDPEAQAFGARLLGSAATLKRAQGEVLAEDRTLVFEYLGRKPAEAGSGLLRFDVYRAFDRSVPAGNWEYRFTGGGAEYLGEPEVTVTPPDPATCAPAARPGALDDFSLSWARIAYHAQASVGVAGWLFTVLAIGRIVVQRAFL
jgi:hypothetical protein